MKVEIITIGDELLIGQVVDTNSAWMAAELNNVGIKVAQITTVSDNPEHLVAALDEARQRADVVLITGGLGPTKDDRTKKVLTKYFHSKLVLDEKTLEHVSAFFKRCRMDMSQLNKNHALVPKCCKVLFNPVGTAPGMWFEHKKIIFVSMPGVPFEMKALMTGVVIPRLKRLNENNAIVHKTILTFGIPESILAEKLEEWESALPEYIHLAYLPDAGRIRLRLSAFGSDEQQLKQKVEAEVQKLRQIIPDAIYGYDNDTLAGVVGQLLIERKATMATAESCTGGLIAHLITLVPGSSQWFKGSVVSYANEIKEHVLKVSHQSLSDYGAVSEQVVRQMAEGARNLLNTGYAVATSGIAGPDGGTIEKPVGTVWITVAGPEKTITKKFNFVNNREQNITRSARTALNLLRLMLIDNIVPPVF